MATSAGPIALQTEVIGFGSLEGLDQEKEVVGKMNYETSKEHISQGTLMAGIFHSGTQKKS